MGSFASSQSQLPPACSSAAAAATATACASQRMLLAPYGGGYGEDCNIFGDSKTIATAATSNDHCIIVSLRREPFSALSRICLCYLPGTADRRYTTWAGSTVLASHGGSVLVRITTKKDLVSYAVDYFVYSNVVGDPARRPSLYPLRGPAGRCLHTSATGLLCRGEAEFVVAELTIVGSMDDVTAAANATGHIAFELRLFRHGEWSVKQPWIIRGDDRCLESKELWAKWETIAAVPLGNGMLCWVDCHSGVIFSDVFDDGSNKLRYVAYPDESTVHRRQRLVCTDVRGALKLVSMAPQRCSHCGCCEHDTAFNIWTLKTDDLAWVLETETETNKVVDSTELWVLPDTPGYARTHLVYPVESMNGGGHIATSMSGGGDNVSDVSSAPMEEEDEDASLSVNTPSATPSVPDGLRGSNGETSDSTDDQRQGDNEPGTEGRWPKRRRRANSMVTGPEWIAK